MLDIHDKEHFSPRKENELFDIAASFPAQN